MINRITKKEENPNKISAVIIIKNKTLNKTKEQQGIT